MIPEKEPSAKGFALIELLPATLLLAVVATVTMKALSLDLRLRQRAQFEMRLKESLSLAMDRWESNGGAVILCDVSAGEGWDVVDYAAESWLPPEVGGGEWIAWKRLQLVDVPGNLTAVAYRSDDMAGWEIWMTIKNWQMPIENPDATGQEKPS